MICSKCGEELPDNSKFCHACGAKLEEEPKGGFCSKCGSPVPLGSKFCSKCGAPLGLEPGKDSTGSKKENSTVEKICNQAFVLYGKHDYDEAIAEYTRAIELDPNYYRAYAERGECYKKQEKYWGAISEFGTAIDKYDGGDDKVRAQLYNSQGLAWEKCGRNSEALQCIEKAVKLDPGEEQYRKNRIQLVGVENHAGVLQYNDDKPCSFHAKIRTNSSLRPQGEDFLDSSGGWLDFKFDGVVVKGSIRKTWCCERSGLRRGNIMPKSDGEIDVVMKTFLTEVSIGRKFAIWGYSNHKYIEIAKGQILEMLET
jgi:tetratricopeptide (TPR) repeat protein